MNFTSSTEMFCATAESFPVLTPIQTAMLTQQAAAGNKLAADKLLKHNLRIAIKAVTDFRAPKHVPLCNLYSDAVCGIIRAIELYKPGMGVFYSLAYTWALYYLQKGSAQEGFAVRVSEDFVKQQMKVRHAMSAYYQLNGVEPDLQELVALTGYTEKKIGELLSYGVRELDCNCSGTDDEFYNPYAEALQSDDYADTALLHRDVEHVLSCLLDSRKADIIRSLFGIGCKQLTAKEVGVKWNLTEQRVRQLRCEALQTLQARKDCFLAA